MDFSKRMKKVLPNGIFSEDGYYVWCGSMAKYGDCYFIAYSRWKRELGFEAWVTDSEICLAIADSPEGEFRYIKTLLTRDGTGRWDATCAHNPTLLEADGRFYLYYMGNRGCDWWDCRNHQRIGVISTDDPFGEWSRHDAPLIDVSAGGFDDLMVSNPTVARMPDGRFIMVYKAVSSKGELPKGGDVVCGVAFSEFPDRDFVKLGEPIMCNPTNGWSVEDPFIWCENGKLYALVSDFHGYFTRLGTRSVALFESCDGIDWRPSRNPLAFRRSLPYESGEVEVERLERPQIYFEGGRMRLLLCACAVGSDYRDVFNVRIRLSDE